MTWQEDYKEIFKKGGERKIGDPQNCPGVLGLHLSKQNIQKSF